MITSIVQNVLAVLFGLGWGYSACLNRIGVGPHVGVFVIALVVVRQFPNSADSMFLLMIVAAVIGALIAFLTAGVFKHLDAAERHFKFQSSQFNGHGANYAGFGFQDADAFFGAHTAHDQSDFYRTILRAPQKDYYAILGVERTASDADIKHAYRQQMKSCHPDLFPGDKEKEALVKEINEAYEVLSDPQKRAAFDRFGFV
jgi:DnaJ domain